MEAWALCQHHGTHKNGQPIRIMWHRRIDFFKAELGNPYSSQKGLIMTFTNPNTALYTYQVAWLAGFDWLWLVGGGFACALVASPGGAIVYVYVHVNVSVNVSVHACACVCVCVWKNTRHTNTDDKLQCWSNSPSGLNQHTCCRSSNPSIYVKLSMLLSSGTN